MIGDQLEKLVDMVEEQDYVVADKPGKSEEEDVNDIILMI